MIDYNLIYQIHLIEGMDAIDKAVLISMAMHYDKTTGRCDPGMARVAKKAGVSRRTAIRARDRLVKMDIITVTRHSRGHASNWYAFDLERCQSDTVTVSQSHSNRVTDDTQPCHSDTRRSKKKKPYGDSRQKKRNREPNDQRRFVP